MRCCEQKSNTKGLILEVYTLQNSFLRKIYITKYECTYRNALVYNKHYLLSLIDLFNNFWLVSTEKICIAAYLYNKNVFNSW